MSSKKALLGINNNHEQPLFFDVWYEITEGYIIFKTPSIPIHLHKFGFELHTDRLTLSTRLKNDAGWMNYNFRPF